MKKLLCILLCLLIALSVVVSLPANAAESSSSATGDSGDLIFFNAKGWKNYSKIYCHIYEIGGKSFFDWQARQEECTNINGTIYKYDLSKFSLGKKTNYAVIFGSDNGYQTYDCTIGPECIGDTLVLTGKQLENPADSYQKVYEAKWQNNNDKYGPCLAMARPSGNVVGEKLIPGEEGYEIIGEWVYNNFEYFKSKFCDLEAVLAKAYPKLGIKTAEDISKAYSVCNRLMSSWDDEADALEIKKIMENAFNKAYPKTIKTDISKWTVKGIKAKTYTGKAIKQKITVVKGSKKATVKISYKNNKNAGKAKMIIEGTGDYKGTITKTFVIKRAANPVKTSTTIKLANYKVVKYTNWSVKPITVKKAKGKVVYKKASGSKNLTVKSNGTVVVKKGTKKGVQTAKVKVTAKGNKNYKSKSKTVNIKIVVC